MAGSGGGQGRPSASVSSDCLRLMGPRCVGLSLFIPGVRALPSPLQLLRSGSSPWKVTIELTPHQEALNRKQSLQGAETPSGSCVPPPQARLPSPLSPRPRSPKCAAVSCPQMHRLILEFRSQWAWSFASCLKLESLQRELTRTQGLPECLPCQLIWQQLFNRRVSAFP